MRFVILVFALFANVAMGATEASSKKQNTNYSFDDLLVQGKYQFTDESVTTVEDDKVLDALLSVRKDFKDRIKSTATRR
jgi:hypothetical protein